MNNTADDKRKESINRIVNELKHHPCSLASCAKCEAMSEISERLISWLTDGANLELFRFGWEIYPKNVGEVIDLLKKLAQKTHEAWLKAMKDGIVPNEDVSPGESFLICAKLIEDAVAKPTADKNAAD